jgi:ankyrin repeat protein
MNAVQQYYIVSQREDTLFSSCCLWKHTSSTWRKIQSKIHTQGNFKRITILFDDKRRVCCNRMSDVFEAIKDDDLPLLKHLLKVVAINNTNEDGWSPLHVAVAHGRVECMECLLDNGASVNIYASLNSTVLYVAAINGQLECMKLLVARGVNLHERTSFNGTLLHSVADHGHFKCIQYLVDNGLDVNGRDADGTTPLHYACEHGFLECVEQLIANGARVNIENNWSVTPLMKACQCAFLTGPVVVKYLLRNFAKPEVSRERGGLNEISMKLVELAASGDAEKQCILTMLSAKVHIMTIGKNSTLRILSSDIIRKLKPYIL